MLTSLRPIVHAILEDNALLWFGDHGISHWARVLENGLRLSTETGADPNVVSLFAVFHDSRRINEFADFDHGKRGAELAAQYPNQLFELPDSEFDLLYTACVGHTHERTHANITIQTCWDADRLDLGRVGITPHPNRLCTSVAKRREIIDWADSRAQFRMIPDFVSQEWKLGIE